MSSLRNSYGAISNTRDFFILSGTDDGIIGGNSDAAVDGSVTEIRYYIQPSVGVTHEVVFAGIEISDSGNPGLDDYGSVSGPLTNGIVFFTELDGVQTEFGLPIKSNRELVNLGPLSQQLDFAGSTKITTHSFNILDHAPTGIMLHGNHADKFGIIVRDDLTSLIQHSLVLKGSFRSQA